MLQIHGFAVATAAVVSLPPYLADMPVNAGAVLVYGLVGVSVFMVLYYGLKKPKGPGGAPHA